MGNRRATDRICARYNVNISKSWLLKWVAVVVCLACFGRITSELFFLLMKNTFKSLFQFQNVICWFVSFDQCAFCCKCIFNCFICSLVSWTEQSVSFKYREMNETCAVGYLPWQHLIVKLGWVWIYEHQVIFCEFYFILCYALGWIGSVPVFQLIPAMFESCCGTEGFGHQSSNAVPHVSHSWLSAPVPLPPAHSLPKSKVKAREGQVTRSSF